MSQAKDKAKELVDRFKRISVIVEEENATWFKRIGLENAKQCALICVDEMLKQPQTSDKQLNFLVQVKQEINKIQSKWQ